ncbi:RdgB/HAM1 family non-canonical purine NTP pyrophosphatase [Rheinheimera texasensis]|uniref:RdgB/HAM1 family non-canonical purine NTP pyrophosphatase n=1 Tax=Rheinheimera texasensis TaxID=306205 RepID=UPI0032B2DA25
MFNQLVLASSNAGKVAELQSLLADAGIEVLPQTQFGVPDADETGLSFIENAILKARHAARLTGLPAIADDSGLAVYALGGAPGIYSARYAAMHNALQNGETKDAANIRFLLKQMEHQQDRRAEFHCVLALVMHADDPVPLIAHGRWAGQVSNQLQGEGGFGYDPMFWLPDLQKTAAQLSKAEKSLLSHRGQALRLLLDMLQT